MKRVKLLSYLSALLLLFQITSANAQYQFPACYPAFDPAQTPYNTGELVSMDGINYECAYYVTAPPPSPGWRSVGACGDGGLGADYAGEQRVIGYLPYWWEHVDLVNNFEPEAVTHINIAFNLFKQNNNDFNSANFASIAWGEFHKNKVDSILFEVGILEKAHQAGRTVSVAIGGATDFAFIWLMEKYYNNDAKMEEIANLIVNYVNTTGIDGIDLDLECWWADPAISGTVEKGGRIRGSKSGDPDQGPEPAAIGLTILAQKLKQKMPNKLLSAAVFATSWYGNNYDDAIAEHLDWLGLMTYDYTGSWNTSPKGPHSSLYKVPLNTYEGQSDGSPIYSVQDGLEFWMGIAEPAWNHDGGFNVPKAKLCAGVPLYGYDFSQRKPNNGNGYLAVPYNEIVTSYSGAETSYDPKDPNNLGGLITADGRQIYYNTPAAGAAKINYTKNFGHQGLIVWEVTQDVPFANNASIMKAIMNTIDNRIPPTVSITSPAANASFDEGLSIPITATASDADGTVSKVDFYADGSLIGTASTSPYSINWNNASAGLHNLKAVATDNDNKIGSSALVSIQVNYTPVLTSIEVSPISATVVVDQTQQYTAQGYDQTGAAMSASFSWSATGGTISTSGLFTGTTVGNFTVTAISGSVSANATATVTATSPVLTSIIVSPAGTTIDLNATQQFSAQAYDQNNNAMSVSFSWSATGGTVSTSGLYSGTTAGTFTITATSGAITGDASITVNSGGACTVPAYVENGGYSGGSQVENIGIKYECKPFPYEGWCNGDAWAYAPGTGNYWADAWIEIGPCTTLKSSLNTQSSTISTLEGDASTYPNPFMNETNIKFKLLEASHVEIKVYNNEGIEISTLLNQTLSSGYHKVKLDGSCLPAGHYIYIIRLNNDAVTGKLIKK